MTATSRKSTHPLARPGLWWALIVALPLSALAVFLDHRSASRLESIDLRHALLDDVAEIAREPARFGTRFMAGFEAVVLEEERDAASMLDSIGSDAPPSPSVALGSAAQGLSQRLARASESMQLLRLGHSGQGIVTLEREYPEEFTKLLDDWNALSEAGAQLLSHAKFVEDGRESLRSISETLTGLSILSGELNEMSRSRSVRLSKAYVRTAAGISVDVGHIERQLRAAALGFGLGSGSGAFLFDAKLATATPEERAASAEAISAETLALIASARKRLNALLKGSKRLGVEAAPNVTIEGTVRGYVQSLDVLAATLRKDDFYATTTRVLIEVSLGAQGSRALGLSVGKRIDQLQGKLSEQAGIWSLAQASVVPALIICLAFLGVALFVRLRRSRSGIDGSSDASKIYLGWLDSFLSNNYPDRAEAISSSDPTQRLAEWGEILEESPPASADSADSAEPLADSADSADSAEPLVGSAEPLADSAGSADSAEPLADSAEPLADSAEPLAGSADSAEPLVGSHCASLIELLESRLGETAAQPEASLESRAEGLSTVVRAWLERLHSLSGAEELLASAASQAEAGDNSLSILQRDCKRQEEYMQVVMSEFNAFHTDLLGWQEQLDKSLASPAGSEEGDSARAQSLSASLLEATVGADAALGECKRHIQSLLSRVASLGQYIDQIQDNTETINTLALNSSIQLERSAQHASEYQITIDEIQGLVVTISGHLSSAVQALSPMDGSLQALSAGVGDCLDSVRKTGDNTRDLRQALPAMPPATSQSQDLTDIAKLGMDSRIDALKLCIDRHKSRISELSLSTDNIQSACDSFGKVTDAIGQLRDLGMGQAPAPVEPIAEDAASAAEDVGASATEYDAPAPAPDAEAADEGPEPGAAGEESASPLEPIAEDAASAAEDVGASATEYDAPAPAPDAEAADEGPEPGAAGEESASPLPAGDKRPIGDQVDREIERILDGVPARAADSIDDNREGEASQPDSAAPAGELDGEDDSKALPDPGDDGLAAAPEPERAAEEYDGQAAAPEGLAPEADGDSALMPAEDGAPPAAPAPERAAEEYDSQAAPPEETAPGAEETAGDDDSALMPAEDGAPPVAAEALAPEVEGGAAEGDDTQAAPEPAMAAEEYDSQATPPEYEAEEDAADDRTVMLAEDSAPPTPPEAAAPAAERVGAEEYDGQAAAPPDEAPAPGAEEDAADDRTVMLAEESAPPPAPPKPEAAAGEYGSQAAAPPDEAPAPGAEEDAADDRTVMLAEESAPPPAPPEPEAAAGEYGSQAAAPPDEAPAPGAEEDAADDRTVMLAEESAPPPAPPEPEGVAEEGDDRTVMLDADDDSLAPAAVAPEEGKEASHARWWHRFWKAAPPPDEVPAPEAEEDVGGDRTVMLAEDDLPPIAAEATVPEEAAPEPKRAVEEYDSQAIAPDAVASEGEADDDDRTVMLAEDASPPVAAEAPAPEPERAAPEPEEAAPEPKRAVEEYDSQAIAPDAVASEGEADDDDRTVMLAEDASPPVAAEAPAPEPERAAPEPEEAAPEPEEAAPEPEEAAPEPEEAAPEPKEAAPEPEEAAPEPEEAAPEPKRAVEEYDSQAIAPDAVASEGEADDDDRTVMLAEDAIPPVAAEAVAPEPEGLAPAPTVDLEKTEIIPKEEMYQILSEWLSPGEEPVLDLDNEDTDEVLVQTGGHLVSMREIGDPAAPPAAAAPADQGGANTPPGQNQSAQPLSGNGDGKGSGNGEPPQPPGDESAKPPASVPDSDAGAAPLGAGAGRQPPPTSDSTRP